MFPILFVAIAPLNPRGAIKVSNIENIIYGLVFLFFAFLMLVLNKRFARLVIESQNKFWGFRFGEREIRNTRIIGFIVGTGFLIIGFLSLFQIIHFR